ncbi:MAG: DUF2029 domain-containing protein [Candidatus Dormibacteraeota bacterium]|uniref:DUF2029 domain-containing protein n=1 Tax=Candidatus Amunia macphersoniae TaxID=3127014 RepID=A0A934NFF5_9BACT|nr:DUF2029 domain-containing protein [Candidatus Dormibacteraeota bacterium]
MSRPRPSAAVLAGAAVLVLAAYAVLCAGVSQTEIGRSDFASFYVGGTLLRQGHGAAIYDQALQGRLHADLVAPDQHGNLPFVNPPAAALLVAPLTPLPLATAYRVWQAVQLLLLVAAVLIAARFAPWPPRLRRTGVVAATVVVAVAGTGTLALGLLGQWDGLSAFGLAAGYALWRRDARFAGGAVLALCVLLAKPHLALGLAALVLGWRERRVLAGAASAIALLALGSLVATGPGGFGGLIAAVRDDAGRWPLASMLGFTGLTGSWLGSGTVAQLIAAVGSLVALAACLVLGRLARDRRLLEPCLAAATVLSLLASPHLLTQDLVLLAPMLVILTAWAAGQGTATAWPARYDRAVLAGWAALSAAAALDLGSDRVAPPGRLVPWVLITASVLLLWLLSTSRGSAQSVSSRPAS